MIAPNCSRHVVHTRGTLDARGKSTHEKDPPRCRCCCCCSKGRPFGCALFFDGFCYEAMRRMVLSDDQFGRNGLPSSALLDGPCRPLSFFSSWFLATDRHIKTATACRYRQLVAVKSLSGEEESDADEICQSDIRRVVSCHCEHDYAACLYCIARGWNPGKYWSLSRFGTTKAMIIAPSKHPVPKNPSRTMLLDLNMHESRLQTTV